MRNAAVTLTRCLCNENFIFLRTPVCCCRCQQVRARVLLLRCASLLLPMPAGACARASAALRFASLLLPMPAGACARASAALRCCCRCQQVRARVLLLRFASLLLPMPAGACARALLLLRFAFLLLQPKPASARLCARASAALLLLFSAAAAAEARAQKRAPTGTISAARAFLLLLARFCGHSSSSSRNARGARVPVGYCCAKQQKQYPTGTRALVRAYP